MKHRQGFVSNSSSSSFCIVGLSGYSLIVEEMLRLDHYIDMEDADIFDMNGYGYGPKARGSLQYLGCYCNNGTYMPDYVGIPFTEKEYGDIPVNFVKKVFVSEMKKHYNLDVPIELVHFHYGEVSSE